MRGAGVPPAGLRCDEDPKTAGETPAPRNANWKNRIMVIGLAVRNEDSLGQAARSAE